MTTVELGCNKCLLAGGGGGDLRRLRSDLLNPKLETYCTLRVLFILVNFPFSSKAIKG